MFKRKVWLIAVLVGTLMSGPLGTSAAEKDQYPIRNLVRRLELGKSLSHGSLTFIPVYRDKVRDNTAFFTLEDALKKGWISITEVEGGRVPQVKISNTSRHLIFLMGGEILTGCRQDRILAGDILLAPGTRDLMAPVYCVEHGRWSHTSSRFYSKQNLGTPALRATAQEKSASAQSEIWARIADQNRKMGISSDTEAYQEAYENEKVRAIIQTIEKKMRDFPRLDHDAVGVVIGMNDKLVSVDIFANPSLFAKQWPKILRSSAFSAIGNVKGNRLERDKAAEFLRSLINRRYIIRAGLDLGLEYTSIDSDASIQALVYKHGVMHLSGFPHQKDRMKVIRDTSLNSNLEQY